jgi:hypothetical protein
MSLCVLPASVAFFLLYGNMVRRGLWDPGVVRGQRGLAAGEEGGGGRQAVGGRRQEMGC